MYCTKCGAKNPDNANFCIKCGNRLNQLPDNPQNIAANTINNNITANQTKVAMEKQIVNNDNYDSDKKIGFKHHLSKMLLWISLMFFSIILTMLIITEGLTKGTLKASMGLMYLFLFFLIFVLIKSFIYLYWGFYRDKNYEDENSIIINPENFRNDKEKELYSIVSSLSIKAGLKKIPTVKIYNDNGEINAYASSVSQNNSLITVYRTSLEKLDKDELTAVIAHEIGHIVNGDALTTYVIHHIFNSLIFIFLTIPALLIKAILKKLYKESLYNPRSSDAFAFLVMYRITDFLEFVVKVILWFFAEIVKNFHSRIREFEADRISAKLQNPESVIKLMNTLKNNNSKSSGDTDDLSMFKIFSPTSRFDLLKDHPHLDRRIQAIKEFQDTIANGSEPVNTEKAKEYKRAAIFSSLIILPLMALIINNNLHKSSELAANIGNSTNYTINNNSVGNTNSYNSNSNEQVPSSDTGLNNELIKAAENGNIDQIKTLLSEGSDVNTADKDGFTALMYATSRGYTGSVKLLLDKGADVNATDKNGNTALMSAATFGYTEIVKLLLDKGADVNATDKNGGTALMCAAMYDNTKVVKLLLDKGADVNATDKDGNTALMSVVSPPARTYNYKSIKEIVRLLLDKGADVNVANKKYGFTALMYAAMYDFTGIVKLLLDKGANVNATSKKDGGTALMYATTLGFSKIIKLLLDKGANVNATSKNGTTALMLAEKYSNPEHSNPEVIKLLKAYGAKE